MAAPNSQPLAAAPMADSAIQQAAVTAPQSTRCAPGVETPPPKQGATMVAPPSPQGAPGFAVVPQQAAHVEPPASPQGPPGFWAAPEQVAPTPPQGAPVMAPPQGATMMSPQQQHFAPELVPSSQQSMQMAIQAASMGVMMASMPMSLLAQAAQAQAMAVHQPTQGMAPSQSLPTMEMLQAQAGHMMAHPSLPLGPPPLMLQQQQQPPQTDKLIMTQPPMPLGPPPAMLQQQPPQGALVMMPQPPMPFSPPSAMLQHNPLGNQMMVVQPQLSAVPCKRQRADQYENPYGQHMTGHQQEASIFNAVMGQTYGPNLNNGFPFGVPVPCLPPDASSTIYVEGLPTNCTRREVAHIFRQYMGFRELRLVNKGPNRHAICFVDFATPEQAFLAMRALQGYKFDEQDQQSRFLNLQFSHSPRVGPHGGC